MVPTVEFPPTVPFTSQFTEVLVVPETLALNCLVCFTCTLALVGEMDTDTAVPDRIVTVALADAHQYELLCAVTRTAEEGTAGGAL